MKYKSILPFIGEYAVVSIVSDKYGVIDRSANIVEPPTWDMIEYAGGGLIYANAMGYGLYHKNIISKEVFITQFKLR